MFFFRKSPIKAFWNWFSKNEDRLYEHAAPEGSLMQQLTDRLRQVHEVLTWEMSAPRDGRREFVISADGIHEGYFAVESLADAAPPLRRFQVIRLRPRIPDFEKCRLSIKQREYSSDDFEFQIHPDGVKIGLVLYANGLTTENEQEIKHAAFLMLDTALGEHDMLTRIGFVEVLPSEPRGESPRLPFGRIRAVCDAIWERQSSQNAGE